MRVAYVQTEPIIGKTRENLDRAIDLVEKVREADLVVLPELFHSGYNFESNEEAESLSCEIPGGDACQAIQFAARKWELHIVAGILERDENNLYNSTVLVDPAEVILRYRKIHLFDREKEFFKAGDEPPGLADIGPFKRGNVTSPKVKTGMLICFDWIFPGVWNYLARDGAHLICHPSNLVMEGKAERGLPVRAMENKVFIICANRVGVERGLRFVGASQIIDPTGAVLSKAPADREYFDMVEIDPLIAEDKFVTGRNHIFDDARWDLYPPLQKEE